MREVKHLKTPTSFLDVVSYNEYKNNKELYGNSGTAIEVNVNNIIYALPYKKKGSTGPGIYDEGIYSQMVLPESDDHRFDGEKIINVSKSKDINEFMEKNQMIKDMEADILTNPDNITVLQIDDDDTEEMIGFKEAINAKHIDIDKYENRFGANFPNEKRLMKGKKISIDKIKRICNNVDIGVGISYFDKSKDVPNPMGTVITKVITGGIDND